MRIIIIYLFLVGCGPSDSTQTFRQEGESNAYVNVRMDFIDQIAALCKQSNPPYLFNNQIEMDKAIADCTFEHMSAFSIDLSGIPENL